MTNLTKIEPAAAAAVDADESDAALLKRLARLQRAQIAWGRSTIVLVEGWDGSGRGRLLKALAGAWYPCRFTVCSTPREQRGRHWLTPFWERLPGAGDTAMFRGGWYQALVADRAAGACDERQWARRCDEINEFEAQQRDRGTILIKLFLDVAPLVQQQRLAARAEDPWRAPDDDGAMAGGIPRETLQPLWSDLFARTGTRWAPWQLIDANDPAAARRALLEAVADDLTRALPKHPPERGGS